MPTRFQFVDFGGQGLALGRDFIVSLHGLGEGLLKFILGSGESLILLFQVSQQCLLALLLLSGLSKSLVKDLVKVSKLLSCGFQFVDSGGRGLALGRDFIVSLIGVGEGLLKFGFGRGESLLLLFQVGQLCLQFFLLLGGLGQGLLKFLV